MALDSRPCREDLTSREIARILGAVAGGLLQMADPEDIMDAFQHYYEFRKDHLAYWKQVKANLELAAKGQPPKI